MHISEQVSASLSANGWQATYNGADGRKWQKRLEGYAPDGTISNGARVVHLRLDPDGRWLERLDIGLGRVAREVDLRNWPDDPQGAIREALL